jgi:hypothetical protein
VSSTAALLDAPSGLRLHEDGTPVPDVAVIDLDRPVSDVAATAIATAAVAIGVAQAPLTAAAQRTARRLTCTLVPHGLESSPAEVGVVDPARAADDLVAAVYRFPRAAVTLATHLRVVTRVAVADGLALESAAYSTLLAGGEFRHWLAGRPPARRAAELEPPVRIERHGAQLDVVLDRPHRRNAFGREMRDALVEAFDLVLGDPSIERVTLSGTGPAFCSGGDLAEFGTTTDVSTAHLIRLDRSVAARIDRCQDRVVARLHGACIGAGIEIPSFAGRVLARPDAFFQLPELVMGLLPGAGGTVGIGRRIGRWRVAYLLLAGCRLDVTTALDWGLIDAVDDH